MTQDELHILVLALLCNLLSGVDYDLRLTNMVLCFAPCGGLSSLPVCMLSEVQFFVIPWTVACQAPLSMEFSRQDTEVGYHFLFQGIFFPGERR